MESFMTVLVDILHAIGPLRSESLNFIVIMTCLYIVFKLAVKQ